jgi:hypothetical protein
VKFNKLNNVFYKELKVHMAENNTVGFWHYLQPSAGTKTSHPDHSWFQVSERGNSIPFIHPNHFLRRYTVYLREYTEVLKHLRINAYDNKTRRRRK